MVVKVMSDEQVQILRSQIAAYSIICEQLVDLHKKSLSSHHHFAGIKAESGYDEFVTFSRHRQRWMPKRVQLRALEHIFEQENVVAPSRQKIREIVSDLSQHSQISEMNVHNWFQNRCARSRKHPHVFESESRVVRMPKSEDSQSQMNSVEDLCFQTQEVTSGLQPVQPRPETGSGQMSFYQRMNQMTGKAEVLGVYDPSYDHHY